MFVPQQRPKRGNIIQRSINLVEICWTLTGNHPKLLLAHAISLTASLLAGWAFIVPNYFFVHASIPHALFGVFLLFALASLGILIGNVVLIVGALFTYVRRSGQDRGARIVGRLALGLRHHPA